MFKVCSLCETLAFSEGNTYTMQWNLNILKQMSIQKDQQNALHTNIIFHTNQTRYICEFCHKTRFTISLSTQHLTAFDEEYSGTTRPVGGSKSQICGWTTTTRKKRWRKRWRCPWGGRWCLSGEPLAAVWRYSSIKIVSPAPKFYRD